jgi:hypothetical protein
MKKIIAAVAIASALVLGGCSHSSEPQNAQRCEEDQPCWDCDTMGNGICGEDLPQGAVVLPASECPLFVRVCFDHPTPYVKGK